MKGVPGVTHASAALTAVAPVAGSPGESLYVLGVDFLDDGFFRDYRGAGKDLGNLADDLELLNSTDRMLISERFARDQEARCVHGDSATAFAGAPTMPVSTCMSTGPRNCLATLPSGPIT